MASIFNVAIVIVAIIIALHGEVNSKHSSSEEKLLQLLKRARERREFKRAQSLHQHPHHHQRAARQHEPAGEVEETKPAEAVEESDNVIDNIIDQIVHPDDEDQQQQQQKPDDDDSNDVEVQPLPSDPETEGDVVVVQPADDAADSVVDNIIEQIVHPDVDRPAVNEQQSTDAAEQPNIVDETPATPTCGPRLFRCHNNSRCILGSYQCDGAPDCQDGSDELDCMSRTCPGNEFKCVRTGRCIGNWLVCNNRDNCGDNSDENLDCRARQCGAQFFQCRSSGKCVEKMTVCDGRHWGGCDDASDEENCLDWECHPGFFKCNSTGICIPPSFACNGRPECSDGSDEDGCPATTCPAGYMACASGVGCIRQRNVCNGEPDCRDWSDEADCPPVTCPPDFIQCANYSVCLGPWAVCDEYPHCPDGSDELGCLVITNDTSDFALRLVNGTSPLEGRLEVFHNGLWGTVCDDSFSDREARVVCSTLGHGSAGRNRYNAFGPGTGRIWLDDVQCIGSEQSLANCRHNGWGRHNCGHGEDVSVSCAEPATHPPGSEVDVRLVGGPSPREGRLEVFHNGEWGTVCDDEMTPGTVQVVCNSLGYGAEGNLLGNRYGPGSGSIWLDNVRCVGYEQSIGNCPHNGWGVHNCGHGEDMSMACTGSGPGPTARPSIVTRPPTNVRASRTSPTAIRVTWDAPTLSHGQIAGYRVFYRMSATQTADAWNSVDITGQQTSATITQVSPSDEYAVRVRAVIVVSEIHYSHDSEIVLIGNLVPVTPPRPTGPPTSCPPGHFHCRRSRRCISEHLVCDLDADCGPGDDSDEHNCPYAVTEEPSYYNDDEDNTTGAGASEGSGQI